MNPIDRLYSINNKTVNKSMNVDDNLYITLVEFINKNFDATISDVINVCIEDFKDCKGSFYIKPKDETVTYRGLTIRQKNLDKLQKIHENTGVSKTRILNATIRVFLEKYDNKR